MPSLANPFDTLVLLGATASGKTSLGVELAHALNGEIISADSRQVYRGLDIGSGKDIAEYAAGPHPIPYHLIDICDLNHEFSVFEFQRRAYDAHADIVARSHLPIVVGGTGLYLDAILNEYRMVDVPEDPEFRDALATMSNDELSERLTTLKGSLHNTTDTADRARLIRALEIESFTQHNPPEPAPDLNPLVLGIEWDRPFLHDRIARRLEARVAEGMIEEVEGLLAQGIAPERLDTLGLEYRFVAQYLQGTINNQNDLFQKLLPAIKNFAKRQGTWFRRMEKKGVTIHWLAEPTIECAMAVINKNTQS
jgi:tRNA dimethylallyltransferase